MEINLKNKTAWVFGGSRGIGRAIAIELSRVGVNILLIARKKPELQSVKEELCVKMGQEHDFLSIDLSCAKTLRNKIGEYRNTSAVDIVINNTGGPAPGPAHTAEVEEYLSAFEQHIISANIIMKVALKYMKKKRFGRIINIISTSVKQPISGLGVSNTIRGAVANWSKTLSSELGLFGITVNNILPGATSTDRLAALIKKTALERGITENEVIENMKKSIPINRFGNPEEIGYVVVFLCSQYANYINGINIPVDGGRTLSL